MTMLPAWYTTTSTKKNKKLKFKSAEEKRKYYELQESWETLKRKHDANIKLERKTQLTGYSLQPPPGRESRHYPSRDSGTGYGAKLKQQTYTGDKIIGIGTLHKSNAVPVFSDEEAKDMAKMRR